MDNSTPSIKTYRNPLTETIILQAGRVISSSTSGNLEPFSDLSDYDW